MRTRTPSLHVLVPLSFTIFVGGEAVIFVKWRSRDCFFPALRSCFVCDIYHFHDIHMHFCLASVLPPPPHPTPSFAPASRSSRACPKKTEFDCERRHNNSNIATATGKLQCYLFVIFTPTPSFYSTTAAMLYSVSDLLFSGCLLPLLWSPLIIFLTSSPTPPPSSSSFFSSSSSSSSAPCLPRALRCLYGAHRIQDAAWVNISLNGRPVNLLVAESGEVLARKMQDGKSHGGGGDI